MRLQPVVAKLGELEQLTPPDILDFGKLNIGLPFSVTLAANAITISRSHHVITATDGTDLYTINGGEEGDILILRNETGFSIKVEPGIGNLLLPKKCILDEWSDTLTLCYTGISWLEISRAET